jgi:outer membrane receptor protein involved in Fe transport
MEDLMRIFRGSVLAGVLWLATAAALAAQTTMATVRGRIVDEQGAVLPGVTVTARAIETNLTRTVTSTEIGDYFIPNLPAGTYELSTAMDGFSPARRERLVLAVGQEAIIDFTLKVGGLQEAVTISGDGAVLETTQHTLGSVINSKQIDDLPTIGRNFGDLARLAPGVTTGVGGNGDSLSFNGQRGYANGIFVDGASNEWNYYGSQASSFAQDWIQEFQVMTNSFAAEYGTASGGLLNVITRSGTNTYQGRAYGFFRDDALDAAPFAGFFVNGEPQYEDAAPPLSQQRFGGFVGGPIMKDRLFFFTGVERLNADSSAVLGISEYWRNRGLKTILPTGTEDTPYIFKGDAQLNARNRVSVRYDHSKKLQVGNGDGLDTEERRETFGGPVYNIVGNWTSSVTNTAFNEVRAFWGSNKPPIICPKSGTGGPANLALGPPGTFAGRVYPGARFGCTVFTGLEGEQNFSLVENFSWVTGPHQFKVGGTAGQVRTIIDIVNYHDGRWTHPFDVEFDINNSQSYPDAFTGNIGGTTAKSNNWAYALFAQDTWRVSEALTLNLGLRYDLDRSVKAGDEFVDAKNDRIVATLGGGPRVTKTDVDTNNVAPRVGFTWKPMAAKPLTIRGAAGVFYDQAHNNFNAIYIVNTLLSDGLINLDANNPALNPFYNAADPSGSRETLRRYLAQNYPFFPDLSLAPRQVRTLNLLDPSLQVPYTTQYTGGFTYELIPGLAVQADYVHSRGEDQLLFVDENAVLTNNQIVRPDSRFAALSTLENLGWLRYNALQTDVRYRTGSANVGVAYTLAKTRSNYTATIFGGGNPTKNARINGDFDLSEDEGPDNVDRRHNLVVNGAYTFRYDVQLAGIWTYRSAAPYSVSTRDQLDSDPFADRPEPRNSRRGDSFDTVDLRVTKTFRVGPRMRVSGFWELFNAFNTDNFTSYQGSLQSSLLGLPTDAYEKRRQQIGFRVDF